MLTEKPEHMTDEEWSAFNDDEMGEAPKAKYEDAEVKLDDEVERYSLLILKRMKITIKPMMMLLSF